MHVFVPVADCVVSQLLVCVKDCPEQTVDISGDHVVGTHMLPDANIPFPRGVFVAEIELST